jgi:hypothetical protein
MLRQLSTLASVPFPGVILSMLFMRIETLGVLKTQIPANATFWMQPALE